MSSPVDVSPEREQAARDLVAATRELMLAAATTELDTDTMRSAGEAMAELTRLLGKETRPRVVRAPFDGPARSRDAGPGHPWSLFAYNPMAIPLEISFTEDGASAHLVANALHEGPHDSLHGGFIAHLLDCMLGTLMQARRTRAVTASLDLRYLHRTPLDEPLELHSRILEISGRKTIAEGWIEHDGRRTAEARGLFVAIEVPA